ncbi:MAG TPA: hypothetical protein VHN99_09855, partial [Deinococcales bacterium]|nr:hypothetical protein [Deinococcales bacterium]
VSALGGRGPRQAQDQARRQAAARRLAEAQRQAREAGRSDPTLEGYLEETALPEDDPLGHRAARAPDRPLDVNSRGPADRRRADQEALRQEMARKLGREPGGPTVRTLADDARLGRLKTTRDDHPRASQAPNLSDHRPVVMPNQESVVMASTRAVVMPSNVPTISSGPQPSFGEGSLARPATGPVNLRDDLTVNLPPAVRSGPSAGSVNPATPRLLGGDIVQAIILAEVLGPPVAKRRTAGPFRRRLP